MKNKKVLLVSGILLVFSSLMAPHVSAKDVVLNDGWSFSRDGQTWHEVTLPHDWAIGEDFDETIDAQDVTVKEDGEKTARRRIGRTGALPWIGEGWYRRTIKIPDGVRAAELWFDGAMSNPEVFVDGKKKGEHKYGYSPFVVPLPNRSCEVKVHLTCLPQSSRWYPGGGLIRPVTLRLDPTNRLEDVFIRTERLANGKAYMRVTTPKGERTFVVENPKLWTPETPHLYTLEPEGIRYGIRTIGWTNGVFTLNGVARKFKGVCLHHDLGSVGAAFNPAAFRRQVRLLKEIGCDAIRTAHNIPSSEQMDICDEMGMMVMAESFDEWSMAKCANGYHTVFDAWWRKDLEALIRFHRNHPSIVMWSIGNEITDQREAIGTKFSKEMIALCHRLDPTRPVTQGHSWMPQAIEAGGVQEMDIPGVTYRLPFYGALKKASKYGGVLGAETASTVSSRGFYAFPDEPGKWVLHTPNQSSSYDVECCPWSNLPDDDWAVQDDNAWTLGEFVWTGFDYLGEPAPYDDARSRSSYFGMYDLAGLPKDRAFLYRARWRTDVPTLHVLPHWTWPDRVGKVTPVYVYTSYPSAELFVNGKSQGRRTFDKTSRLDRYRLRWRSVVYEPGELKVVAYDKKGRATETKIVRTAGKPHHLVLTADRTKLAGKRDLAFVTVDVVDKDGELCPHADARVTFTVLGAGRYHSACNGDATDFDAFSKPSMRAFNGRLVAVLAGSDQTGDIVLTANAKDLPTATVRLVNTPPALPLCAAQTLKNARFECAVNPENGGLDSLVLSDDPDRMNWIDGFATWGVPVVMDTMRNESVRMKLSEKIEKDGAVALRYRHNTLEARVSRVVEEGCLRETYTFVNTGTYDLYFPRGALGVYATFNDNYQDAATCLTKRCHAHIWCGGTSSYVQARKMGLYPVDLALVLTKGSLDNYSVERVIQEWSNDRGDFILHPSPVRLLPGETYTLSWVIKPMAEGTFKETLLSVPDFCVINFAQETVFEGESFSLTAETGNPVKSATVLLDGVEIPFVREGDTIRVSHKAETVGEHIFTFIVNGKKSIARGYVSEAPQKLIEKRIRFIVEHQQMMDKKSPLYGAYLIYDTEEKAQYFDYAFRDWNACRERFGMGLLICKWLQTHRDAEVSASLDLFEKFVMREAFDEKTGAVFDTIGNNPKHKRLYNAPWVITFWNEMYALRGDEKYLDFIERTMRDYYKKGGARFYPNGSVFADAVTTLRKAGRTAVADELQKAVREHIATIMKNDVDYPPHEVRFEQTIVTPAHNIIAAWCHFIGPTPEYVEAAKRHLGILERFAGVQPDHKWHSLSIRHWDGMWFGKRRLYGDNVHYWCCLTAYAYALHAKIADKPILRDKTSRILRNLLCLYFSDGTASCAYLHPFSVRMLNRNGSTAEPARRGEYFDPYANDQDFALYYLLRILELHPDALCMP